MNFEPLDVTDRGFRDEVRAFLTDNLPESLRHAARLTPSTFFDPDIYLQWQKILHRRGWLAYNWPAAEGGPGWTPVQRYIFERECALANAPLLAAQGLRFLAPVLHHFGTQRQKEFFLPRILTGEHLWCQGYSEPEAGSDLAALRTRAARQGDHYVVNGTKIWTTNAHLSNWIFCLVRTNADVKPQQGISFLLIDMQSAGIEVTPIEMISGDRELNQVFFEDVRVPIENLIGAEGEGWTIAKFLLEHERGGSCQAPGMLADLAELRKSASTLRNWSGCRLIDDRDFMHRLAMVELAAEGMDAFELELLYETASGKRAGPKSALTGLYIADIRQALDRLIIEAHGLAAMELERRRPLFDPRLGAPTFSDAAQVAAPTYLNNRAWSIMAGSSEVMRTIIAKSLLNL